MKKTTLTVLLLVLISAVAFQTSCKKSSNDEPAVTSNMIGNWQGTQGKDTIAVTISSVSGGLSVTTYTYSITRSSLHFRVSQTNSSGLAALSGLAFSVPLGTGQEGPASISGLFNSLQDTLNGTYAVYMPGDTLLRYTGNYQALKVK
jgi:hypothetical protein